MMDPSQITLPCQLSLVQLHELRTLMCEKHSQSKMQIIFISFTYIMCGYVLENLKNCTLTLK